MPYRIEASGAGPWLKGQEVADQDFEAHPFKDKFLRNRSVVKVDESAPRDVADQEQQVADLNAQIAQLTAQRDALLRAIGGPNAPAPPEPHAPAQVAYDLDRQDQPGVTEADASRAAGAEVIQPTGGEVVVGEVVPGEVVAKPADSGKGSKK